MKSLLKFSEKTQPAEHFSLRQTASIKGGDDKRPPMPPPPPPGGGGGGGPMPNGVIHLLSNGF